MRFVLLALIGAGLPAQSLRLPASTAAVKWMGGYAASLDTSDRLGVVEVWDRQGKLVREARIRDIAENVRQAEVKDFALDAEGDLHISLAASFSLGRSARLLCTVPPAGAARCAELGEVLCFRLAAAADGSVWCLGPGLGGALLHRVTGPVAGPRLWLPEKAIRLLPDAAGELRAAYESGALGQPWLSAPAPGRMLLFVPNAAALYDVDLDGGDVTMLGLPFLPPRRSWLSFAARGKTVLGLFPLSGAGEVERLDTPYGLHLRENGWRRVAAGREWRRGAALAGMEEGAAWVWDRTALRLERVPIE